jgi:hypothetical protein
MSTITQIRINKTKEVSSVLKQLKKQYTLLDDSELIKLALSELYNRTISDNLQLDDPRHPYHDKLTPEEEGGVKQSLKDLKAGKTIELKTAQDIKNFAKSLNKSNLD